MKIGVLTLITFIISFLAIVLLNLELWAFILIFAPLYLIAMTIFTAWHNMHGAVKPEPIPPKGFDGRIAQMNTITPRILQLGFREIDRFYVKMIPDVVVYAFRHNSEPVYFCLYHLGTKMANDFITRYGYDVSLTTNNITDAGVLPRPAKAMLQIFPRQEYEQVFSNHISAHKFIQSNGFTVHDFSPDEFRPVFMESMLKQWLYLKKHPLWPLTTIFKSVTKIGIGYRKPIQDQWEKISSNIHND